MNIDLTFKQWNAIHRAQRANYIDLRLQGCPHEEAFCRVACSQAINTVHPTFDSYMAIYPDQYSQKISDNFEQQVEYWKMRFDGQSHKLAEMLATRSFPAVRGTDSDFMKGSHIQDTQLDEYRHRMANAQGVDTTGKRYLAGLAAFPGDPEAWVSGTSDVKRVCEKRGWNCHGAVEYEAPDAYQVTDADRDLKAPIAPDIIRDTVADELSVYDPREITPQMVGDVQDQVTKRLSGETDTQDLRVRDYSYEQSVELSEA